MKELNRTLKFTALIGWIVIAVAPSLAIAGVVPVGRSDVSAAVVQGDEHSQLLEIGRQIYVEGIRPSGQPVTALINGDIPIQGTQFSCLNCHQRSGLGSIEGWQVATPVNEDALYSGNSHRPAYSDQTLARAMRTGIDPTGRLFAAAMPAFDLNAQEMQGLIRYMKSLSAEVSAGVTDEEIHFGTVIVEGSDASGMLAVLEAYFKDKNTETRFQTRRRDHGTFYRDNQQSSYRKWVLHRWTLEGPPETWETQLESYYKEQPVFALVSGVSPTIWEPIHRFCERRGIPSILPNVDVPVVSDKDFYTIYFSKGHQLEAGVVARHLVEADAGTVVQIHDASVGSTVASDALRRALEESGVEIRDVLLAEDRLLTPKMLKRVVKRNRANAVVLWLSPERFDREEVTAEVRNLPRVYLSATQLGEGLDNVPKFIRDRGYLVHPFTVGAEFPKRFRRVEVWLNTREVEVTDRRILGQTWFACTLLREGMMHIRFDNFYRDFFLESIDHTTEKIIPFSSHYPAPSFGPGQRYISKGSYVVDLSSRDVPAFEHAEWVMPR